jgi:hypothetical protein
MAGERHLFRGEEDADLNASFTFYLGSTRENEGSLTKVRLSCECLHLVRGEAARVREYSERVALKRIFREDVDQSKVVGAMSRGRHCS